MCAIQAVQALQAQGCGALGNLAGGSEVDQKTCIDAGGPAAVAVALRLWPGVEGIQKGGKAALVNMAYGSTELQEAVLKTPGVNPRWLGGQDDDDEDDNDEEEEEEGAGGAAHITAHITAARGGGSAAEPPGDPSAPTTARSAREAERERERLKEALRQKLASEASRSHQKRQQKKKFTRMETVDA